MYVPTPQSGYSLFTGRTGTPTSSTMTNDELTSLFRNLCGIEMTDANSPHRLLRLAEYERRSEVINHATLRLLQLVQQASPSIPEPYVRWMSDRIVNACNAMLSQADPRWMAPLPLPPPVPPPAATCPPVPPEDSPGPPIVLRKPVVYRPSHDGAQLALGAVSLLVVVIGIGFGAIVFTPQTRPSPPPRKPPKPSYVATVPTTPKPPIHSGGGKASRPSNLNSLPVPKRPPVHGGTGDLRGALRHLQEAVAEIKKGRFDAGEEYAAKARRADPTCKEADAVVLVSQYVRQYTKLADEALASLDGSSIVDLGPDKGECLFIEKGDDWVKFRVNFKNERFTMQELSNLPGVRFRITRQFLDNNAHNPGNNLILGAYQYIHGLDSNGVVQRKSVNPIPDCWGKAARSSNVITREQAAMLLELPRLELHQ
jgi:hypothetical protein